MQNELKRKLAGNESVFRSVNEGIKRGRWPGEDDEPIGFRCECARLGCNGLVMLTRTEYEYIRSDPRRFVMIPGHELPEIESVVDRAKDHVVVEKEGAAADIAIHLDRSSSTDSGSSNNALQVSGACVDDRLRVLSVQIRREKGN